MMKKILIVLLVAFVILQFFRIDQTNPPVNKGVDFLTIKKTPEPMATLIRQSCYDCHSNETKYPWYANIQPVGWFLKDHIEEGRKELNFSIFATYDLKRQEHKLEEVVELIENGEMPMESFVMMHPEANLTNEKRAELIAYFKKMHDTAKQDRANHVDLQQYQQTGKEETSDEHEGN